MPHSCFCVCHLAAVSLSFQNKSARQPGPLSSQEHRLGRRKRLSPWFCVAECSSPAPGPGKEWEEYVQIRSLVEKIRKKQKGTFSGTVAVL